MTSFSATFSGSSPDRDELDVYRYGPWVRASVYVWPVLVLGLAVFAVWGAIDGHLADEPPHMLLIWGVWGVSMTVSTWRSTNQLLSDLYLGDNHIRRTWPLAEDQTVAFDDVDRVFLGGVTIDVYADGDSEPRLQIERKLPHLDAFIATLARRLPPTVPIDRASSEFDALLPEPRKDAG